MVELFERGGSNQRSLGSKPTSAILLCPWEKTLGKTLRYNFNFSLLSKFQSYLYKTKKTK